MRSLKFLNTTLVALIGLAVWFYSLAYWATVTNPSAEASGTQVLIGQAQKVYEDLIKKGGFGKDKLSCDLLKTDYSDLAQRTLLKVDNLEDGEPLFTPERAEEAIAGKTETFMQEELQLSGGQLEALFTNSGSNSLAGLEAGQLSAVCELQQYENKAGTASRFTIPYLKSGVQEIQNTVMSTVTNTVQATLQKTKEALVKMTKKTRQKFTSKSGAA